MIGKYLYTWHYSPVALVDFNVSKINRGRSKVIAQLMPLPLSMAGSNSRCPPPKKKLIIFSPLFSWIYTFATDKNG